MKGLRAMMRERRDRRAQRRAQEQRDRERECMRGYYKTIAHDLQAQRRYNAEHAPEARRYWLVCVMFLSLHDGNGVCAKMWFKTEVEARAYIAKVEPLTADLYPVN